MNVYFQLEYDGKIQAYLKMTGLQASDLNKSKSKKKADTSKQNTHSAPPQNQMGMHAGQMMQHLGYATTGNQATMMAPMGFPSSMASALPHFQQIWSAGQMYDQNQINQMQLMAAQAQQAQTTMMPGQQNGAAFFQQIQAAQQQQQQQTQGQAQPQQVQAAQVQQQPQDTTAVQIQQQVSPIYNGSPQMRSVASPQLNSTSPLNVTPQQATQQPVVAAAQEPRAQATFDQQINDSTATAVTNSSTTWSWHDPNAQGQQFDITGQNGPNTQDNGLIAAAAQQAFGESQQQQQDAVARRMSNEISQASVGTPQSSDDHKSGQPSPQGEAAQTPTAGEVTNPTTQVQTSEQLVTQQQINQSPQTTVDGQSQASSNQEQIVPQAQQIQSAHVVYNSYANYPWGSFPTQADGNQAQGQNGEGDNKVQSKETMLEAEVNHLRSALSEKTKEVQRLGQELEKAYQIIEQLKGGQVATGAVASGGGGSM